MTKSQSPRYAPGTRRRISSSLRPWRSIRQRRLKRVKRSCMRTTFRAFVPSLVSIFVKAQVVKATASMIAEKTKRGNTCRPFLSLSYNLSKANGIHHPHKFTIELWDWNHQSIWLVQLSQAARWRQWSRWLRRAFCPLAHRSALVRNPEDFSAKRPLNLFERTVIMASYSSRKRRSNDISSSHLQVLIQKSHQALKNCWFVKPKPSDPMSQ